MKKGFASLLAVLALALPAAAQTCPNCPKETKEPPLAPAKIVKKGCDCGLTGICNCGPSCNCAACQPAKTSVTVVIGPVFRPCPCEVRPRLFVWGRHRR